MKQTIPNSMPRPITALVKCLKNSVYYQAALLENWHCGKTAVLFDIESPSTDSCTYIADSHGFAHACSSMWRKRQRQKSIIKHAIQIETVILEMLRSVS